MLLSDFLTPTEWAISPDALDPIFQSLLSASNNAGSTEQTLQVPAPAPKGNGRLAAPYTTQDGVAIIEIDGAIHRKSGSFAWFSWSGQDQIRQSITTAIQDINAHSFCHWRRSKLHLGRGHSHSSQCRHICTGLCSC